MLMKASTNITIADTIDTKGITLSGTSSGYNVHMSFSEKSLLLLGKQLVL